VVGDVRAGVLEELDQLHRRRLAPVGDVGLVGDPEDEHTRAGEGLVGAVIQRLRDPGAAVVGMFWLTSPASSMNRVAKSNSLAFQVR
jgi:hypothetical protein